MSSTPARPPALLAVLLPLALGLAACSGAENPKDTGGGGFDGGGDGAADGAADGAGDGAGDGGAATCETELSFTISGTVTMDGAPVDNGEVSLWSEGADGPISVSTEPDGSYTLEGPAGDWTLEAGVPSIGCYAPVIDVSAEVCDELSQDIAISSGDCITADKPNLYLYPKADTAMSVGLSLGARQVVVAADPPLRMGSWRGVAHPDGTFTAAGAREPSPFLFYEVSLRRDQLQRLQRDEGWCIEAQGTADAAQQMADLLGLYDFNAGELDDFVEAWRIDLPLAQTYVVYPQREVSHLAGLHLRPALPVDRLWLLVEDGAGCPALTEPVVEPMRRDGAHGVEWGVVLGDLVR